MLGLCLTLPLLCFTADPDAAAAPSAPELPIIGIDSDTSTGQSLATRIDDGDLVYTTQLLPSGPKYQPTSPVEQVSQAFSELHVALEQCQAVMSDVVMLNVYVSHPSIVPLVEQQLKTRFKADVPPAVSWVQTKISDQATMIALDAVARVEHRGSPDVRLIKSPTRPEIVIAAIQPEGSTAYISGQAEAGNGTLADATKQTMASLFRTLRFLQATPAQVVQIKAFMQPMSEAKTAIQQIEAAFQGTPCPPVSLVEWSSALPIEIEMVVGLKAAAADPSAMPLIEFLTPPGMSTPAVYCRVARVNVPRRLFIGSLQGKVAPPDSREEAVELFDELKRVAEAGDSDLQHLAKGTYYVSSAASNRWFTEIRPDYFQPIAPPAASKATVAGTARSSRHILVDMIAVPKWPHDH